METGVATLEKYKMHIGRGSGQKMIKEYLRHKSIWIETSNAEAPNPFKLC